LIARKKFVKPIIFRLKGKTGKQMAELLRAYVKESGNKNIHVEEDFDKACLLAVELAKDEPAKTN